jgi:uncharacterized SAM-binding protein YcdF (DUF218 family)
VITERERFIVLVGNDRLVPGDAIILLEGDGKARVGTCVRLFEAGLAPRIVASGGMDQPAGGCRHSRFLKEDLLLAGIPEQAILVEDRSRHTRDQAVEVMALARAQGWRRILLVATHYHQYRAYLTFLKAMDEAGLELEILNAPARDPNWFEDPGWGRRIDLLESELEKIETYSAMGHLASFARAIAYQEWKECRLSI